MEIILTGIGTALTIAVNLAPFSSLHSASKSHNLEEISHLYLLLANITQLAWALYGFKGKIWLAFIPSMFAFCIGIIWIVWYHMINKNAFVFMLKYTSALFGFSLLLLNFINVETLGLFADIISFIGMIAPLEQVIPALVEKNHRYIDIKIIVACVLNGFVWLAYGILINNNFIIVPNMFTVLVCSFQITIYGWAKGVLPEGTFALLSDYIKPYSQKGNKEPILII
ncbi:unnamed protein product [Blepharisma stoltei]|uniref:Sugar transporter SWEET n=1 Tax=Blepharisma stoltei TaxID=1481888 RepID=A0AAU9JXB7_9CILI|nr:unnamed protein product [Blepharisma stoltei]